MLLLIGFVIGALTPEARLAAAQTFLQTNDGHNLQEMWHSGANSIWKVAVGGCCHEHIVAFSGDKPTSALKIVDGAGGLRTIDVVGSAKGPLVLLETVASDGDDFDRTLATLWLPTMALHEAVSYYGMEATIKRIGERVDIALAVRESAAGWSVTATAPLAKDCSPENLAMLSDRYWSKTPGYPSDGAPTKMKLTITLEAEGKATITSCTKPVR